MIRNRTCAKDTDFCTDDEKPDHVRITQSCYEENVLHDFISGEYPT